MLEKSQPKVLVNSNVMNYHFLGIILFELNILKGINLIEGEISLKKVLAFLSYTLLALLLAVACYGLSVQFMEGESQKNEVRGVVKEKFQNLAVANILSQYEEEVQYWVRLEDGRRLQLPASIYKEVAKGEQLTLVKSPGSPIFLSR
jgi:hypothetical protein